jgi:hypothetical protein
VRRRAHDVAGRACTFKKKCLIFLSFKKKKSIIEKYSSSTQEELQKAIADTVPPQHAVLEKRNREDMGAKQYKGDRP